MRPDRRLRIQRPHHGCADSSRLGTSCAPLPLTLIRHPSLGAFFPSAFSSLDVCYSILPVGAWLDRLTYELRRQPALLRLFRHPGRLPGTSVRMSGTPCRSSPLVSCPSPESSKVQQIQSLDEAAEDDEGGEADVMDAIDAEITVPNITLPEEITSWSRNDDEGSRVDVSVITNIKPVEFEDVQFKSDDDTDDDEAYVNDGHIAPLGEEELDDDEGFFV
ncbi:hypothetical protein ZWY2020_048801 [Hordeum vulgare]|nr:hypothetical protein ZWY2020_048801 [Hordeum vulgare]